MRRRYRQDLKTGKLIEIVQSKSKALHSIKITESFVSSVDGTIIRNTQDLREHNRRNGVSNDPDHLKEQVSRSNNRSHQVGTKKERTDAIRDSIERVQSSGFRRTIQYQE